MVKSKPKKPKIQDLVPNERQQKLLNYINSRNLALMSRDAIMQRLGLGRCASCSEIPHKLITYQLDGIQKLERYCNSCYEKRAI